MASPDRIEILEKAYSDLVGERDRLRDARAGFTARLGPLPAAAAIASASPPAGRGAAARGGTESHEAVTISGMELLVGAVIDGIPENAALGVSLLASDSSVGVVLLAAIFLANVPESISGAVGMRAEGRSRGYVFTVWGWPRPAAPWRPFSVMRFSGGV